MSKGPQKGSPRWMTTFTDLTMLLLTFFCITSCYIKARCSKIVKDA